MVMDMSWKRGPFSASGHTPSRGDWIAFDFGGLEAELSALEVSASPAAGTVGAEEETLCCEGSNSAEDGWQEVVASKLSMNGKLRIFNFSPVSYRFWRVATKSDHTWMLATPGAKSTPTIHSIRFGGKLPQRVIKKSGALVLPTAGCSVMNNRMMETCLPPRRLTKGIREGEQQGDEEGEEEDDEEGEEEDDEAAQDGTEQIEVMIGAAVEAGEAEEKVAGVGAGGRHLQQAGGIHELQEGDFVFAQKPTSRRPCRPMMVQVEAGAADEADEADEANRADEWADEWIPTWFSAKVRSISPSARTCALEYADGQVQVGVDETEVRYSPTFVHFEDREAAGTVHTVTELVPPGSLPVSFGLVKWGVDMSGAVSGAAEVAAVGGSIASLKTVAEDAAGNKEDATPMKIKPMVKPQTKLTGPSVHSAVAALSTSTEVAVSTPPVAASSSTAMTSTNRSYPADGIVDGSPVTMGNDFQNVMLQGIEVCPPSPPVVFYSTSQSSVAIVAT
jgi:hypothetical protein